MATRLYGTRQKFTLYTGKIAAKEIMVTWYNPRNGESQSLGKMSTKISQEFIPPSNGYGQDWVLIVDDSALSYEVPTHK